LRFRPRRLQLIDHEANPHGTPGFVLGHRGHPFPQNDGRIRNGIIDNEEPSSIEQHDLIDTETQEEEPENLANSTSGV